MRISRLHWCVSFRALVSAGFEQQADVPVLSLAD